MSRCRAVLQVALLSLASLRAPQLPAAVQPHPGWPRQVGSVDLDSAEGLAPQIVDLLGDGTKRIFVGYEGNTLTGSPKTAELLILRANGDIETRIALDYSQNLPGFAAFLDLDSDGAFEFAYVEEGRVTVRRADGSVAFAVSNQDGDPGLANFYPWYLSVAELDGDGQPWLIAFAVYPCVSSCWPSFALHAFDRFGRRRTGWPVVLPTLTDPNGGIQTPWAFVPPAVSDLDSDGGPEVVVGDFFGNVHCYEPDGQACEGYPVQKWVDYAERHNFSLSPFTSFRQPGGDLHFTVVDRGAQTLVNLDSVCNDSPGFPVQMDFPQWPPAVAEIGTTPWILGLDPGANFLVKASDGSPYPGWPAALDYWGQTQPIVGDLGGGGGVDFAFAGHRFVPGSGSDWYQHLVAIDLSGEMIPGFPIDTWEEDPSQGLALGTLDGVNTTLCWAPSSYDDGFTTLGCWDLGVPWDRGKVQFGQFCFDLQHTSRFRRLYQIDRSKSCLTVPSPEVSSEAGTPFDVTVCPIDADGSPLGPDQAIRFARNPVIGEFVGPVRYDAASGTYARSFLFPSRRDGATVEFKVFVNEEPHSQRPTVRFRGRPRIDSVSPWLISVDASRVSVDLSGAEMDRVASVRSTTVDLSVVSYVLGGFSTMTVTVRPAPGALPGWSGLELDGVDGRVSNAGRVFLYDPAVTTLLGWREARIDGRFEWIGGGGDEGPLTWTLQRSTDPRFGAGSTTVVYRGALRSATDPAVPADLFFYRVVPQ